MEIQRLKNGEITKNRVVEIRDKMIKDASAIIDAMPDAMTLDQASFYLSQLQIRSNLYNDGRLISRFLIGVAALRVKELANNGDGVTKRIAEEQKIGLSTLRLYIRIALKFGCNVKLFARWVNAGDYQKTTKHLYALAQVLEDPSVLGPELTAQIVADKVEEAAEYIDRLGVEERETADLILSDATLALREKGRLQAISQFDRGDEDTTTPPNGFFDMVRSMSCMATGSPGPSECHHVASGGWALKGSDWSVIPLSCEAHRYYHDHGPTKFKEKYGIDVREGVARILHIWITGQDLLTLPKTS